MTNEGCDTVLNDGCREATEVEKREKRLKAKLRFSGAKSRECGMKGGIPQGTPAHAGNAGLKAEINIPLWDVPLVVPLWRGRRGRKLAKRYLQKPPPPLIPRQRGTKTTIGERMKPEDERTKAGKLIFLYKKGASYDAPFLINICF